MIEIVGMVDSMMRGVVYSMVRSMMNSMMGSMMNSMVRCMMDSMVRSMMGNMVGGMMETTMGHRMSLNMDMTRGIMVYSVDMVSWDMMDSMMNRMYRGMDNSVDNLCGSCFDINYCWSINNSRSRSKVESWDRSRSSLNQRDRSSLNKRERSRNCLDNRDRSCRNGSKVQSRGREGSCCQSATKKRSLNNSACFFNSYNSGSIDNRLSNTRYNCSRGSNREGGKVQSRIENNMGFRYNCSTGYINHWVLVVWRMGMGFVISFVNWQKGMRSKWMGMGKWVSKQDVICIQMGTMCI
jgi:hypothetical protein